MMYDEELWKAEQQLIAMPQPSFKVEVQLLVDEWQKRLRIDDWVIKVTVAEDEDPGYFARTQYSSMYRSATMNFRHPSLHPTQDQCAATPDTECTVVHELLHLRLQVFKYFTSENQSEFIFDEIECAIDLTAQALVAAKRGVLRIA